MDGDGRPSSAGEATVGMGVGIVKWLEFLRGEVILAELMFAEWEELMEGRRERSVCERELRAAGAGVEFSPGR